MATVLFRSGLFIQIKNFEVVRVTYNLGICFIRIGIVYPDGIFKVGK